MQSRTELEALEEKLMAAEKPMSFESFAPDIQERFQRAADYADMFVELKNSDGVLVAAMAAYYLCRSTHGSRRALQHNYPRQDLDSQVRRGSACQRPMLVLQHLRLEVSLEFRHAHRDL